MKQQVEAGVLTTEGTGDKAAGTSQNMHKTGVLASHSFCLRKRGGRSLLFSLF